MQSKPAQIRGEGVVKDKDGNVIDRIWLRGETHLTAEEIQARLRAPIKESKDDGNPLDGGA